MFFYKGQRGAVNPLQISTDKVDYLGRNLTVAEINPFFVLPSYVFTF